MDVIQRIVFVIVAALLVALAATTAAFVMGWDGVVLVNWALQLKDSTIQGSILAVLLALGGAYFVIGALRPGRERIVHWQGELGDVDISVQAVEALAAQKAAEVSGINDLKTHVDVGPGGLKISIDVFVTPERSIPELATEVQSRVSAYIKDVVGVSVEVCKVRVKGINVNHR